MSNVDISKQSCAALLCGLVVMVGCSDSGDGTPAVVPSDSAGNTGFAGNQGASTGGAPAAVGGNGGALAAAGTDAMSAGAGGAGQGGGSAGQGSGGRPSAPLGRNEGPFPNQFGEAHNVSVRGPIDRTNAFFKGFGNGRACVSCHRPEDGFSITPKTIQALFKKCGLDSDTPNPAVLADPVECALFNTNDGANSPDADVSTAAARRAAYSLLLSRGLIRITLPVPEASKRQYDVVEATDPYGVGSTTTFSVYRRPLPATNLTFTPGVMWDFRETTTTAVTPPFTPDVTKAPALTDQLRTQAINAAVGHAQAMSPGLTDAEVQSIVDFELSLFSAQTRLSGAGDLGSNGANGGVLALIEQPVTPVCGNLDVYSNNPMYPQCQQYTFDANAFTIFKAWEQLQGDDPQTQLRASIARGQTLFNTKKAQSPTLRDAVFFNHSGDNKNLTCSTCHAAFNVGGMSVPVAVGNVSVGVEPSIINAPNEPFDSLDKSLPYYKLRCNANGMATFVRTKGNVGCHDGTEPEFPADEIILNDPGRAGVAGSWTGGAAFKTPGLRNLSAHPPYFHDGSAATLADVVSRYNKVLGFEFTDAEKEDLVNFLGAL